MGDIELPTRWVGGFDARQVGVHVTEFAIDDLDARGFGKGLEGVFSECFGNRAAPSIEADGLGRPSVSDGVPEGQSHQPDRCTGKTEVFKKLTSADLTLFIRFVYTIQFFFCYVVHFSSFLLMVFGVITLLLKTCGTGNLPAMEWRRLARSSRHPKH